MGNTTPLNALQQVNLTPSEVQEWKERAETGDLEAAFRLAYHMLNQDDEETQKEYMEKLDELLACGRPDFDFNEN